MYKMTRSISIVLAIALLLIGCAAPTSSPTDIPLPTATGTPTQSPTMTPIPTVTPSPTATATATVMPTPTPSPTPTHPLMISVMRAQEYPGSELVIEETLTAGSNYDRYRVSYQSEGLTIYALLTIPQGEKPDNGWPVIIFNHGYIPPEVYRTTERYIAYTDAFSRNSYMLLRPDYRGHDQSEGEAVSSHISPAYTIDVLNGLASVIQHPDADVDNIGMWGHSMGGGITLRSMVVTDTIKAGVIWAGTTVPYNTLIEHWAQRWADHPTPTPNPDDTNDDWDDELWRLDLYDEYQAFWDSIDPFSYLEDVSGPVQIHHGDVDDSVPVEWSNILHESLLAAGKDSELYIYPGNDHNISQSFGTAMQRSVEFFDKQLKTNED